MPKTADKGTALVTRMPKSYVMASGNLRPCMMHGRANCPVILDSSSTDPKICGKRGDCINHFNIVSELVRKRLVTDEQAVARGWWLPRKKDLTKRLLSEVAPERAVQVVHTASS